MIDSPLMNFFGLEMFAELIVLINDIDNDRELKIVVALTLRKRTIRVRMNQLTAARF